MSQLLPYFGLGLLFLAVLGLWVRQSFVARAGSAELLMPRQHRSGAGSVAPHRDLGERIFCPQDWDFVSRETLPEIQRMFQRERTVVAIAWLRRTRSQVSQVMRAHVAGAQQSEDLQLATEMSLALSYFLFLILCNSLIGWVWLHGPVRTRKLVGQTLQWAAQLRRAFEQLMARVDPASCRVVGTHFNHGTVRS
jgi:hypothetical protein